MHEAPRKAGKAVATLDRENVAVFGMFAIALTQTSAVMGAERA